MKTNETIVAVAFDVNFRHAAGIFGGISDYLAEAHLDWRLMPLNFGFETKLMEMANSGMLSGVIGSFVSDSWVGGLLQKEVKAINIFNFSKIETIPSVGPNDYGIGEAAAEHLIAQGAQHFAFFGADGVYYTRLREAGFSARLPSRQYIQLRPGPLFVSQIAEIKSANGLVGVFCSNDSSARKFILEAEEHGLVCGKDVIVVGVDNDPAESIFARIGISSFKQPVRETGYLAAKALYSLLSYGRLIEPLTLNIPSVLMPRESSLASGRARVAQQLTRLLHENLADPELEIAQIARRLGVSRRVLELAVQEQLQTSPYQLLSAARLDVAKQLLKTTKFPIMEVGFRTGYPELHHFSAWFKKKTGQSPKLYRDSNTKE